MKYDMSIHQNPSGQDWAKFFLKTAAENNWTMADLDEGLMTGWFSNAMMAMHNHMRPDLAPVVMPDGSAVFTAEIGQ